MISADLLIGEARTWLGTPYHHQGSAKGIGADCVGFLKGVALEVGLLTPELAAELPTDYSRQPSGGQLRRLMGGLLVPVPFECRAPGDIVLIRFALDPQHLGMLTDIRPDYLIHCSREGVVEHRIDSAWRSRIMRVYRFPALDGATPPTPPSEGGARGGGG